MGIAEDIGKIDKNFEIKSTLELEGLVYRDVREGVFDIYGLYEPKKAPFRRMPDDEAGNVSAKVAVLSRHTAGGRVRFMTDSPYIALKCELPEVRHMAHMPLTGSAGFDAMEVVNENGKNRYVFVGTFVPKADMTDGYEAYLEFASPGMHDVIVSFPLYNPVTNVFIGTKDGSRLERGGKYVFSKPFLFYGSSITQGGCASRPSTAYTATVARYFDADHINLGFSGSCRGEAAMAEYLAGIDAEVFVLDYDRNAPSAEHLAKTHLNVYKKYREAHPDTPILLPTAGVIYDQPKRGPRREIVLDTYEYALAHGDKNVAFINGLDMMGSGHPELYTVDGVHPNDAGFLKMADTFIPVIEKLLERSAD